MKKYTLIRGKLWDTKNCVRFDFDTIEEIKEKFRHELKTVLVGENGSLTQFYSLSEIKAKNFEVGKFYNLVNWIHDLKSSPCYSIELKRNF